MTEGLTLITCTGGRPEAFSRCYQYVSRQTYWGPMQWIVVDDFDGEPSLRADAGPKNCATVTRIFPAPKWKPGENTLARNLLAAISEVMYDKVAFIEDDDWYHPDHAAVLAARLQLWDIVGDSEAFYYHIPSRRYRVLPTLAHSSLCQTGIRSTLLGELANVCCNSSKTFIDVRLWERRMSHPWSLKNTGTCVGIKGLPGRSGIGVGHRPEASPGVWQSDQDLSVLRSRIGDDVTLYEGFMDSEEKPVTEDGYEIFYWKGQKRYRCPLRWESGARCEYDTYNLEYMREHVAGPHTYSGKAPAVRRSVSPVLDSEGRQIVKETAVPSEFERLHFRK